MKLRYGMKIQLPCGDYYYLSMPPHLQYLSKQGIKEALELIKNMSKTL